MCKSTTTVALEQPIDRGLMYWLTNGFLQRSLDLTARAYLPFRTLLEQLVDDGLLSLQTQIGALPLSMAGGFQGLRPLPIVGRDQVMDRLPCQAHFQGNLLDPQMRYHL